MQKYLSLAIILVIIATSRAGFTYPLDGYDVTGMRRIEAARLSVLGKLQDRAQPPGARLPIELVDLRLLDDAAGRRGPRSPVTSSEVHMGRAQREKGKRFERTVARRLRDCMPGADVRRGWQSRSGQDAPDVTADPFWVECKHQSRPSIGAAIRQATSDCPEHRIPVAVVRQDRNPATATMLLDDWCELVSEWWELRGQ